MTWGPLAMYRRFLFGAIFYLDGENNNLIYITRYLYVGSEIMCILYFSILFIFIILFNKYYFKTKIKYDTVWGDEKNLKPD